MHAGEFGYSTTPHDIVFNILLFCFHEIYLINGLEWDETEYFISDINKTQELVSNFWCPLIETK